VIGFVKHHQHKIPSDDPIVMTITIIITIMTTATATITIVISRSNSILIFYFHTVIIALLQVISSLFLTNTRRHVDAITERFLTTGNSCASVTVCDKRVIVVTWLVQSTEVTNAFFLELYTIKTLEMWNPRHNWRNCGI
jgi:hypothetical protein